jgi:hypothetical protein
MRQGRRLPRSTAHARDAAALAVTGAIVARAAATPVKQKLVPAIGVPVERRFVRAVSAHDLVRVVVQRGRRRLGRKFRGRQGPSGRSLGPARPVTRAAIHVCRTASVLTVPTRTSPYRRTTLARW